MKKGEAPADNTPKNRMREREIDPSVKSYEEAHGGFRWHIPERFNMGEDTCDRHAQNPQKAHTVALYYEDDAGHAAQYTFAQMKDLSDRFAGVLAANGLSRGDRFAVMLPQRPEAAIAHLSVYKMGGIAIPLTILFREEALRYRLVDSGAKGILVEAEALPMLTRLFPDLPDLRLIVVADSKQNAPPHPPKWESADGTNATDNNDAGTPLYFWDAVDALDTPNTPTSAYTRADTGPDDPALLIYTSGTTGNPKGALHGHRVLIGHLSGFELSHNFFPQPEDCFWTPADWAWIGGLLDALLAAWHYGIPVVAYPARGPFNPERAFQLMEKYKVRNAFIPPTALKMMAQVEGIKARYNLNLRTIMSGGEALGVDTLHWAEENLGVRINEIYGQTEINYLVGNCTPLWPVRPGSMGRPYPGHHVAVVDARGQVLPPGKMGEVAVKRGEDPVFYLEYWNNPTATKEKNLGDWTLTGDLAEMDDEGYLWFKGRKDDVIISAGYRIGPAEIEDVLTQHPGVALAAVVASPDDLRGSIIKAFIKPAHLYKPDFELVRDIQTFVKERLALHEYPREIEFLENFPMTTTGKIRRRDLREAEERRKAGIGDENN